MLENAKASLRKVPVIERQISGLTIAVSRNDLSDAKEFIRKFENEFINRFGKNDGADAVYQLHTAFFPLTKK